MNNTDIDILKYVSRVLIILLILPLHELAHALVAKKLGDDTASMQGRLTLNPIAHIDPLGAILLISTGFGWAKPVPINPLRMKHYRSGISLTALAGPVSNLIAAFVLCIIYNLALCFAPIVENINSSSYSPASSFMLIILFMYQINIGLAVFNLIPIPPLDGYNIISYFLPDKLIAFLQRNNQYISIAFLILILALNSLPDNYNFLYIISNKISVLIYSSLSWITEVIGYGAIGA